LQQEYADGLVEVRGRVDGLEGRTAVLESQQFSTTTKLNAEIIFGLGSVFGGDRALNSDQWRTINAATTPAARNAARNAAFGASGSGLQNNTIFSDRIRLNLITSFTGKDQLFTRLEANNTTAFSGNVTGTNMTRTSWDTTNNADNSIQLGKLYYRFPVGEKLNVIVDAIGGEFYDNFNTINPLLSSTPIGSLSRFGRFSPIYRASNTSSGSNTARLRNFLVEASKGSRGRNGGRGRVLPPLHPLHPLLIRAVLHPNPPLIKGSHCVAGVPPVVASGVREPNFSYFPPL